MFDEIHKRPDGKAWLKGLIDGRPEGQTLLVSGSARMDTFRQSGESLAGRSRRTARAATADRRAPQTGSQADSIRGRAMPLAGVCKKGGEIRDRHAPQCCMQILHIREALTQPTAA